MHEWERKGETATPPHPNSPFPLYQEEDDKGYGHVHSKIYKLGCGKVKLAVFCSSVFTEMSEKRSMKSSGNSLLLRKSSNTA